MKLHQCSCRIITGFDKEELLEEVADNLPDTNTGQDTLPEEIIDLKPGVRLPKTDDQWKLANQFFHSVLSNFTLRQDSIGEAIIHMNEVIFNYCKDTYGFQENNSKTGLVEKYQHHSLKNLKKDLKLLKDGHASLDKIRYVSRLLGNKLAKKTSTITSCKTFDHDLSISKNFRGYVKLFLQKKHSLLPSFSLERCKQFFKETLSAKHRNKQFPIPSWIPSFSNPTHPFHSDPPPYQKITSIIRRMKSSSSPVQLTKYQ